MEMEFQEAAEIKNARRCGGGKVGRRAVAKNGNASFCESWESCETRARSGGEKVWRCGRYQKMETKFQGAAEIKTREGAAAERSIGAGGGKKWKCVFWCVIDRRRGRREIGGEVGE